MTQRGQFRMAFDTEIVQAGPDLLSMERLRGGRVDL